MSDAAVADGARTPFCRAGGALRAVPVLDLAAAAAADALAAAGVEAEALDGLVAACALPEELGFAAAVAARLGVTAPAVEVGGADAAGLHAVAVGAGMVGSRAVLVVGAESASRAPYLVPGLRWGAREAAAEAVDPLAWILADAARRARAAEVTRAEADAFAARSHARARAPSAERIVAAGGVGEDGPAALDRSPAALAALKPLFDPDGPDTAGAVALPADGAAALVLAAGAPGARVAPAEAGTSPHAAELHEGTASEAVAAARALGLDPERVNPDGGAIGLGHPIAASGVLMVLRLAARLEAGEWGVAGAPGASLALRG